MIGALSLLLPVALAVYFLYRSLRQPIFLLGIPFLQVMARSVFFWEVRPFRMPVALGTNGVILMWMVVAWAWCYLRTREHEAEVKKAAPQAHRRILPEEYLLVALAVLVVGKLLWGSLVAPDTDALLGQFAPWGLLLAGYVIVRGVVRRSDSRDVQSFVVSIAVVTTIASVLFILHQGLGLHIYDTPAYQHIVYQGQVLTRTYWFMSPFLLVALAAGVALALSGSPDRSRLLPAAIVVVTLVSLLISYTRNYVLAGAAVVACLILLRWFKERSVDVIVKRSLVIGAILACAAVILVIAMPGPLGYLMERMATFAVPSSITSDENLLVRQNDLRVVGSAVYRDYAAWGAPFGNADLISEAVSRWTPDSTWVGVLYWTGYAGATLILIVFALYAARVYRLFIRGSGAEEFLGAVLFAGIVAMFVSSLTGWSFLDESVYAMGFWLFAFVAGESAKVSLPVGVPLAAAAPAEASSARGRAVESAGAAGGGPV
jgi:hypothetical protein